MFTKRREQTPDSTQSRRPTVPILHRTHVEQLRVGAQGLVFLAQSRVYLGQLLESMNLLRDPASPRSRVRLRREALAREREMTGIARANTEPTGNEYQA